LDKKKESLWCCLEIKGIPPDKAFGIGAQDGFVDAQDEGAAFDQAVVKKIEDPVLKVRVEVDDHVPADDQVELDFKEVGVLDQVQFLVDGLGAQVFSHLDQVVGLVDAKVLFPVPAMVPRVGSRTVEDHPVEVFQVTLVKQVLVTPIPGFLKDVRIQIAAKDLGLLQQIHAVQKHHHGIDFLAGGTPRVPDADGGLICEGGEEIPSYFFPDFRVPE